MQAVQETSTGDAGGASGKSHDPSAGAATRTIKDIGPILCELDDASGEIARCGSLVEAVIALLDQCAELYGITAPVKGQVRHAETVLRLLARELEASHQRVEDVYKAVSRAPGVEA